MIQRFQHCLRFFLQSIQTNIHIAYGIIATVITLSFVVIVPPFQGPDEEIHYNRAYQLVRGYIFLQKQSNGSWGGCIPQEAITDMFEVGGFQPGIRGKVHEKYQLSRLTENLTDSIEKPDSCGIHNTKNTYVYNPLGYLPAATGIGLVDSFNGPPILGFYMARLLIAISTITMIMFAIRLMPHRKLPFMVLLTMPMLLFQQATISIDGVSFAMLALFIAYTIKLFYQKTIHKYQWVKLGALIVLLCMMKPLLYLFIPMIMVLFAHGKKQTITLLITAVVVIASSIFVTQAVYGPIEGDGAQGSDPKGQIEYLKSKPIRAVKVAWSTYMTNQGDTIAAGIIGVFGAADTYMPSWIYAIAVVNIVASLCIATKEEKVRKLPRQAVWTQIGLSLLYFLIVNGAIYISYSPVESRIIYGVQGRYFLPILISLIAIPTAFITVDKQQYNKLATYLVFITGLVLLLAVFITFQRYYLPIP